MADNDYSPATPCLHPHHTPITERVAKQNLERKWWEKAWKLMFCGPQWKEMVLKCPDPDFWGRKSLKGTSNGGCAWWHHHQRPPSSSANERRLLFIHVQSSQAERGKRNNERTPPPVLVPPGTVLLGTTSLADDRNRVVWIQRVMIRIELAWWWACRMREITEPEGEFNHPTPGWMLDIQAAEERLASEFSFARGGFTFSHLRLRWNFRECKFITRYV